VDAGYEKKLAGFADKQGVKIPVKIGARRDGQAKPWISKTTLFPQAVSEQHGFKRGSGRRREKFIEPSA